MSLLLLLIIVLVVLGVGGAPTWSDHGYGWGPSGIIGLLLVIFVVLLLVGRVHL